MWQNTIRKAVCIHFASACFMRVFTGLYGMDRLKEVSGFSMSPDASNGEILSAATPRVSKKAALVRSTSRYETLHLEVPRQESFSASQAKTSVFNVQGALEPVKRIEYDWGFHTVKWGLGIALLDVAVFVLKGISLLDVFRDTLALCVADFQDRHKEPIKGLDLPTALPVF